MLWNLTLASEARGHKSRVQSGLTWSTTGLITRYKKYIQYDIKHNYNNIKNIIG